MTADMKDRIKKLMENQHMTQKIFAQYTGISEGTLSGIFNGRTRPTLQIVDNIHQRFPKISINWLMFGTGPMYANPSADLTGAAQQTPPATEDGSPDASAQEGTTLPAKDNLAAGKQTDSASSQVRQPSLSFDEGPTSTAPSSRPAASSAEKVLVKYIDKPQRKITEIRIFYDDQTWESFVPKK